MEVNPSRELTLWTKEKSFVTRFNEIIKGHKSSAFYKKKINLIHESLWLLLLRKLIGVERIFSPSFKSCFLFKLFGNQWIFESKSSIHSTVNQIFIFPMVNCLPLCFRFCCMLLEILICSYWFYNRETMDENLGKQCSINLNFVGRLLKGLFEGRCHFGMSIEIFICFFFFNCVFFVLMIAW